MTHSEASKVCQMSREESGSWKWNGKGFDWNPAPECDYEVVKVGSDDYAVQLRRSKEIHGSGR